MSSKEDHITGEFRGMTQSQDKREKQTGLHGSGKTYEEIFHIKEEDFSYHNLEIRRKGIQMCTQCCKFMLDCGNTTSTGVVYCSAQETSPPNLETKLELQLEQHMTGLTSRSTKPTVTKTANQLRGIIEILNVLNVKWNFTYSCPFYHDRS